MRPEISVVICTHNPRPQYLQRVLDALKGQTVSSDAWELVFVDNASDDRLEDSWDLSWSARARHVREARLGLTPARLRGIAEASGPLLVFVDDDNVLASDYLEHALAISSRCKHLGAFGAGMLVPDFETEPSRDLNLIKHVLALRTVSSELWSNHVNDADAIPWGAGLCARREVASGFVELVRRLDVTGILGRRGSQLLSGEDDLFSWISAARGLGFGVFPELRITHLIAAQRVDDRYVLRWRRAHAYSHGVLRFLLTGVRPSRLTAVEIARLMVHAVRDGLFKLRYDWAHIKGRSDATALIARNRLEPLILESAGASRPQP